MPRKYEKGKVIKRLKNGACVMKRVCKKCLREFIGERNLCPQCFNQQRRQQWKDRAAYHRRYYRKYRSKSALLHDPGSLSKDIPFSAERKKAFQLQKQRIQRQLNQIKEAGYDPKNDSAGMIERAGVL